MRVLITAFPAATTMTSPKPGPSAAPKLPPQARLVALAALYALALGIGLIVGRPAQSGIQPTPLARLGHALAQTELQGGEAAQRRLSQVAATVLDGWPRDTRAVLQLALLVRGVGNGGQPDWTKAAALCQELRWPRCDQPALDELQRRSRP